MELLIASVVVLCAGPVFFELLARRQPVMALLDGFVLVSVMGLVVVHLLPEALIGGGLPAVVAAAVGFALPILLDRFLHRASARPHGHGGAAHGGFLWLVIIGLALHAALDGAALSPARAHGHGHGHDDGLLGLAVVLHRLPLGLIIWWLVRPAWSARVAISILLLMATATVVGYHGGGNILETLPGNPVAVFQALIAGGLVHIAFHHPPMLERRLPRAQLLGGIGGVLALGIVGTIAFSHPIETHVDGSMPFGHTLQALALTSAPALLAAFALAAAMHGLLRPPMPGQLGSGGPLSRSLRGALHGLRLPISACGVLPLYQTLVGLNVPAVAALAALTATPAIGLDALAISLPILGWELTLARLLIVLVIAVAVGLLLTLVVGSSTEDPLASEDSDTPHEVQAPPAGLDQGLRYGFGELVDHSVPWLFVGFIVAAFVEAVVPPQALATLAPWDVVIMAVLAVPLFLSAVGTTPLAALLVLKGASPGAALALLIVGPVVNLPTLGVLDSQHGPGAGRRYAALVMGVAVVLGYAINTVLGTSSVPAVDASTGTLHEVCAVLLAVMAVTSLIRRGPRYLIEGMAPHVHALDDHDGHHDHHHGHPHDSHQHHHHGQGHSH